MTKFLFIFLISITFQQERSIPLASKDDGIMQKDTFLVEIPKHVENGRMTIDYLNRRDTSSVTYIFSFYPSSPHYLIDASFFLDVKKRETGKCNKDNYKIISVYQIMDSLKLKGRVFLKENRFYATFSDRDDTLCYETKGEYIYADYSGE